MHRTIVLFFSALLLFLLSGCGAKKAATEDVGDVRPLSLNDSRSYDLLYLKATELRMKDAGMDAAYELYEEAARINPAAAEPYYWMALIKSTYRSTSDTLQRREIDELFELAVENDSLNPDFKKAQAVHFAQTDRLGEAIRIYEQLPDLDSDEDALATLLGYYYRVKNYDAAISCIDRIEALGGSSEQSRVMKFQLYIEKGDDAAAYAAIESLCEENPGDLRYRVVLGNMYEQQQHDEQALAVYLDVLTAEPDNYSAQRSLMDLYKRKGNAPAYHECFSKFLLNPTTPDELAIEELQEYMRTVEKKDGDSAWLSPVLSRLVEREGGTAEYFYIVNLVNMSLGAPESVLAKGYERVLSLAPDNRYARLLLLEILTHRRENERIIELCREGVKYFPADVVFYYFEGFSLYMLARPQEALDVFRRGAACINEGSDLDYTSYLYQTMGDVLYELERKEEAYLAFDTALVYNSHNTTALNNYAYFLCLDGGDLQKAQKMSVQAITEEPESATFLDTHAWVLFCKEDYEEALRHIRLAEAKVTATDDQELLGTIYEHRADIHAKMGNTAEAVVYWKKALSLIKDKEQRTTIGRKIKLKKYVTK